MDIYSQAIANGDMQYKAQINDQRPQWYVTTGRREQQMALCALI